MSEFWVSEGRHWCKYCKKWISSNKIQIRQHEAGEKHIEAEDAFVRQLSSKVSTTATAGDSKVSTSAHPSSAAVEAGELLERISRSQVTPCQPAPVPEPQQPQEEDAYPAPAHEAFGPWVEVVQTGKTAVLEEDVAEEPVVPVLRVGAADAADEEEALAREQDLKSGAGGRADMKDCEDPVFRKRGISKSRKRKRRVNGSAK